MRRAEEAMKRENMGWIERGQKKYKRVKRKLDKVNAESEEIHEELSILEGKIISASDETEPEEIEEIRNYGIRLDFLKKKRRALSIQRGIYGIFEIMKYLNASDPNPLCYVPK